MALLGRTGVSSLVAYVCRILATQRHGVESEQLRLEAGMGGHGERQNVNVDRSQYSYYDDLTLNSW